MATRAYAKRVGVSAIKMRRVADLVRGKNAEEAMSVLKFVPTPAAGVIEKTLKSAMANAENNDLKDRSKLKVVKITVDGGPRVRRFRAKARGRAGAFDRPSSHLTVEVDEA
ncbi:MAG: 50S ribosomal protein L22 [Chloroflexi bacterium]|nr:50S ribosomal protein L22 [Chloroflexota bacterium]